MPRQAEAKKLRGIFEKGKGVFWIRYTDAAGKKHREKVGTRSDAVTLLAKRKTEKLRGLKLPELLRAKTVPFGKLLDDALEHSSAENGERWTAELRLKYAIIRQDFGSRPAAAITKQEIVQWLVDQADEREWSPATQNRYQAAFSLAFRVGIDNEKIDKNPAARIRRKDEANVRTRFLSPEEEAKIRAVLLDSWPQHVPAFVLSIHTGMRASEQFTLSWSQVNWKQRIVTLPKTKNRAMRHIQLNDEAMAALQQLKEQRGNSEWVFLNRNGEQLRGPRDWFDPAVKKAGVANYVWHCNRHTCASRLAMAGVGLREIAELLGHKSLQMVMRYSHLSPQHQQDAVQRLVTNQEFGVAAVAEVLAKIHGSTKSDARCRG